MLLPLPTVTVLWPPSKTLKTSVPELAPPLRTLVVVVPLAERVGAAVAGQGAVDVGAAFRLAMLT
jgi:hypothetical protein